MSENKDTIFEEETETETEEILLLNEILKKHTISQVAKILNLANGTITRWIELKNIPKSYLFDLFKLLEIDIDYSKYSSKEKDQFFTPLHTATYCYNKFCEIVEKMDIGIDLNEYIFIEPSAGDGGFLKVLPENTISMDIEPRSNEIIKQDYLTWTPPKNGKYIVFGNPPFGLRGHLALRFINHSYEFADFVCFILPQLFESDGKGSPRKRVIGYNLIHSEKIQTNFYEPNKNEVEVNTIFQIWSKNTENNEYLLKEIPNENIKIYSLSNGGTPSSTRNKKMLNTCDVYIPSTCFGKENMRYYNSFEELPGKKGYGIVFLNNKELFIQKAKNIKWCDVAFLSTNSAYNLRSSQINTQFI